VVIVGAALDEKVDEIAALMREFLAKLRVIIEGGHDFHPRRSPVFIEGGHPFS